MKKPAGQQASSPHREYTTAGAIELFETLRHPEEKERVLRHEVVVIGIARIPASDLHHLCKTFGAPV